jgi:DNA-directed RNA polymerase specialized sigma24 family protein
MHAARKDGNIATAQSDPQSLSWSDAWNFYKSQHESLQAIMRGMQSSGLSHEDAEDFLHSFVLDRLPRIAALTANMTESERGRYLRASLRNFVRTAVRVRQHHDVALQQISAELRASSTDSTNNPSLRFDVMPAVTQLPRDETLALRLYLGIDGPAHSIRETAEQLKKSRHTAKQLIVNGLVAAAIALGESGHLTAVDVEACREVILNGSSAAATAQKLGLTVERVRRSLQRARDWAATRIARAEGGNEHERQR